jgi:hypothetical protein
MRISIPALAALALSSVTSPGCETQGSDSPSIAMIDLFPEQISDRTRSDSPAAYDRETIFDYINGAGEVYRSYAFSQVVVVVYSGSQQTDITVEMFDMGSPADAYGVFSYAREQEQAGIGGGYEQKGRVLCFWQNRYYVCVASEERTADSDRALLEVARAISERLPASSDPPDLVAVLPEEGLVTFSERFFHLHQSLNYHYYLARENILNLSSETDAVLARYAPGSTYLLLIRYPTVSEAATAATSFEQQYLADAGDPGMVQTENGKFTSYGSQDRFIVVVLDAESGTAAADLLQATMNGLPLSRE